MGNWGGTHQLILTSQLAIISAWAFDENRKHTASPMRSLTEKKKLNWHLIKISSNLDLINYQFIRLQGLDEQIKPHCKEAISPNQNVKIIGHIFNQSCFLAKMLGAMKESSVQKNTCFKKHQRKSNRIRNAYYTVEIQYCPMSTMYQLSFLVVDYSVYY